MPRFFAEWHEPPQRPDRDPWCRAREVLALDHGHETASEVTACLKWHGFTIDWPIWSVAPREHMTMFWIRGHAPGSDDLVVAAIFDAPDVETVRREIAAHDSSIAPYELARQADDWVPHDPTLHPSLQDTSPTRARHGTYYPESPEEDVYPEAGRALPPPLSPHYPVLATTRCLVMTILRLWASVAADRMRGLAR